MQPMTTLRLNAIVAAFFFISLIPCLGQAAPAPPNTTDTPMPAVTPAIQPAQKTPVTKVPTILGWKEWIWIVNPTMILQAKLDTGARTCSIHATNIESIEVDGRKWVKFIISDPSKDGGARLKHKAPVVRIAQIKNDTGGLDKRYVVALTFQIGGREMTGEFTLNDRSQMTCGVLIGRNMLQELGVVDSSRENIFEIPKSPAKRKKAPKKVPAKN